MIMTDGENKKQATDRQAAFPGATEGAEPWIIEMKRTVPGFSQVRRYSIAAKGDKTPFCLLSGLDNGPTFIVVNPFLVVPDYGPVIPDRETRFLELQDPAQAVLFVMVTIRRDPFDVTVNLRAPIVINVEKNLAAQVILEDPDQPLRHSIIPKPS